MHDDDFRNEIGSYIADLKLKIERGLFSRPADTDITRCHIKIESIEDRAKRNAAPITQDDCELKDYLVSSGNDTVRLLITGEMGSGKSTRLDFVALGLAEEATKWADNKGSVDKIPLIPLCSTVRGLARWQAGELIPQVTSRNLQTALSANAQHKLLDQRRFACFFDAYDEGNEADKRVLRDWISNHRTKQVSTIVSSRPYGLDFGRDFKGFSIQRMGRLQRSDIDRYVGLRMPNNDGAAGLLKKAFKSPLEPWLHIPLYLSVWCEIVSQPGVSSQISLSDLNYEILIGLLKHSNCPQNSLEWLKENVLKLASVGLESKQLSINVDDPQDAASGAVTAGLMVKDAGPHNYKLPRLPIIDCLLADTLPKLLDKDKNRTPQYREFLDHYCRWAWFSANHDALVTSFQILWCSSDSSVRKLLIDCCGLLGTVSIPDSTTDDCGRPNCFLAARLLPVAGMGASDIKNLAAEISKNCAKHLAFCTADKVVLYCESVAPEFLFVVLEATKSADDDEQKIGLVRFAERLARYASREDANAIRVEIEELLKESPNDSQLVLSLQWCMARAAIAETENTDQDVLLEFSNEINKNCENLTILLEAQVLCAEAVAHHLSKGKAEAALERLINLLESPNLTQPRLTHHLAQAVEAAAGRMDTGTYDSMLRLLNLIDKIWHNMQAATFASADLPANSQPFEFSEALRSLAWAVIAAAKKVAQANKARGISAVTKLLDIILRRATERPDGTDLSVAWALAHAVEVLACELPDEEDSTTIEKISTTVEKIEGSLDLAISCDFREVARALAWAVTSALGGLHKSPLRMAATAKRLATLDQIDWEVGRALVWRIAEILSLPLTGSFKVARPGRSRRRWPGGAERDPETSQESPPSGKPMQLEVNLRLIPDGLRKYLRPLRPMTEFMVGVTDLAPLLKLYFLTDSTTEGKNRFADLRKKAGTDLQDFALRDNGVEKKGRKYNPIDVVLLLEWFLLDMERQSCIIPAKKLLKDLFLENQISIPENLDALLLPLKIT